MLKIKLNKDPSTDSGGILRRSPAEAVTLVCPDHLVLTDLPVAKGIGSVTSATSVSKTVGRQPRRELGERVHFCVRCDYPIAVYGRLSPCEHAFCLDCARSDSICYLCDERIQKIQSIKMMEGIFICGAPHCLKSFLKKSDFDLHIHQTHSDLLQSNVQKEDGEESELQSSSWDSKLPPPATTVFYPRPISQRHHHDDKASRKGQLSPRQVMQPKMPPPFAQVRSYPTDNRFQPNKRGNFSDSYPPTWKDGPANLSIEAPTAVEGVQEGFTNTSESQVKSIFKMDDNGTLTLQPFRGQNICWTCGKSDHSSRDCRMDTGQGSIIMDSNEILTVQPLKSPLMCWKCGNLGHSNKYCLIGKYNNNQPK